MVTWRNWRIWNLHQTIILIVLLFVSSSSHCMVQTSTTSMVWMILPNDPRSYFIKKNLIPRYSLQCHRWQLFSFSMWVISLLPIVIMKEFKIWKPYCIIYLKWRIWDFWHTFCAWKLIVLLMDTWWSTEVYIRFDKVFSVDRPERSGSTSQY